MICRRAPLAVLALALFAASGVAAQSVDPLFSDFEPSGDMLLSVDGTATPKARIYYSKRAQAFLVRSAELESPVLLDVPGRSVVKLDLLKVSERPDGAIDLLADAVLEPSGTFVLGAEQTVSFKVDGRKLRLSQNPYLLGPKKGSDLLEHDAHYRYLARNYQPDEKALSQLRHAGRGVRVLTFFGSWCPHCRDHVPLLLKAESRLEGSEIEFDYYGLPQARISDEPEAKKWGVNAVPTTIVLVGGREIGRIPASGWSRPEAALADLVGASAAAPAASGTGGR